jgi:hypothetical protein
VKERNKRTNKAIYNDKKNRKEDKLREGDANEPRPKTSSIQSTTSYIISLRSNVTLSSHVNTGLPPSGPLP